MLNFSNDYSEGAHEKILREILRVNREGFSGYGSDPYCDSAKQKIRKAFQCPEAEIFFLTGGTQTNQTVIASLLRRHEGVIAAETGHIGTHEAGAIEYTGHKVLSLPAREGKLSADTLEAFLRAFYEDENREHMVFPGMVYLSYPTEYGTLYTKEELTAISALCKRYEIPLYLDGARLGYGFACPEADITPSELAKLCDVFYIGGTKVGALFGESVVFPKKNSPPHFMTLIKQQGALLAKGWLLGLQFDVLFTDDLYFELGRHAIEAADRLRTAFREKGYSFFMNSPTNQIFIVLDDDRLKLLREKVSFGFWEKTNDGRTVVRFATSWATEKDAVDRLIELL
ncbi:MAG: aminotransferase class V-fold PLP-dependent enzyme [Bacteroides sp.]|nr:aminotransferase class V-fold PLP-dependent enzyme [Eubacterium sp.]MCM1418313.1 aminotransferase class V-fold PLP-dependent enzyme [Roseburia sp.]MCM1462416.1 aminotransferase class V-fold PLP-dependent enzyme [Bacteroides sp.]